MTRVDLLLGVEIHLKFSGLICELAVEYVTVLILETELH